MSLEKLSFENLFGEPILFAKKLEMRWYHDDNIATVTDETPPSKTRSNRRGRDTIKKPPPPPPTTTTHRKQRLMPFLRRNLSYIRNYQSHMNIHEQQQRRILMREKGLIDDGGKVNRNVRTICKVSTTLRRGKALKRDKDIRHDVLGTVCWESFSKSRKPKKQKQKKRQLVRHDRILANLTKQQRNEKKKLFGPELIINTSAFFYYLYRNEEDNTTAQIETRKDRRCPFCFFNAVTDAGLLMHCKSIHGDKLNFDGGIDEKGDLHIAVKANPLERWSITQNDEVEHLMNYIYIAPPKKVIQVCGVCKEEDEVALPFIKKPLQETAMLDPVARKRKMRQLQTAYRTDSIGSALYEDAISQYEVNGKVPIRQYYHSRTNIPMAEGEWDYDSDDVPDDAWIHQLSEKLMDEFGDVSPKEKILWKLWNRYIKCHTITADAAIPQKRMDFLLKHHGELVEGELRDQLMLHFLNLWDNRLLSSKHILQLIKRYDSLSETSGKMGR